MTNPPDPEHCWKQYFFWNKLLTCLQDEAVIMTGEFVEERQVEKNKINR
jgi:hypothetical protein